MPCPFNAVFQARPRADGISVKGFAPNVFSSPPPALFGRMVKQSEPNLPNSSSTRRENATFPFQTYPHNFGLYIMSWSDCECYSRAKFGYFFARTTLHDD